jgi:hypothetical protein
MADEKPKTELIKLNGTIIKSDGSEHKGNFFKFLELNPDDYSDISFTPEEAQRIRSHLMHLSTGASAAIPLTCGGKATCPFSAKCPFVRIDEENKKINPMAKSKVPVGRACLVEVDLLNEWTRFYINEYEINEEDFTEFGMVRELAEIELLLWRINNNLSKPQHAELIQETVVGVDREGNPLTRKEMSSLFEIKERLQNRKSKLFKLMVGDRQEKYKREAALRLKSDDDPSTSSAQLKGQISRLLQAAKQLDIKMKEVEGNVINAEAEEKSGPLTPQDLIDGGE